MLQFLPWSRVCKVVVRCNAIAVCCNAFAVRCNAVAVGCNAIAVSCNAFAACCMSIAVHRREISANTAAVMYTIAARRLALFQLAIEPERINLQTQ